MAKHIRDEVTGAIGTITTEWPDDHCEVVAAFLERRPASLSRR